jgi:hypothetical protein
MTRAKTSTTSSPPSNDSARRNSALKCLYLVADHWTHRARQATINDALKASTEGRRCTPAGRPVRTSSASELGSDRSTARHSSYSAAPTVRDADGLSCRPLSGAPNARRRHPRTSGITTARRVRDHRVTNVRGRPGPSPQAMAAVARTGALRTVGRTGTACSRTRVIGTTRPQTGASETGDSPRLARALADAVRGRVQIGPPTASASNRRHRGPGSASGPARPDPSIWRRLMAGHGRRRYDNRHVGAEYVSRKSLVCLLTNAHARRRGTNDKRDARQRDAGPNPGANR